MVDQVPPSWLEVSLTVNGELAEAVSEVLARFVTGGVVVETTAIAPDPDGEGHPVGPLRVCGYLPLAPDIDDQRQKLEEALWYLGRIIPLPLPQYRPIQEVNWMEAWKQHYRPIPIGNKLIIIPSWIDFTPENRKAVKIDPGMAFGTGTHPTTQLCLEMLEDFLQTNTINSTIDVGCGSGILTIAAVVLGVNSALAVDIDPEAIQVARDNAQINGVINQIELGIGSVPDIVNRMYSFYQAPLVFANILAPTIIQLLETGLADIITPGGYLIASGILNEQADSVIIALHESGLKLIDQRSHGDWIALGITRA